MIKKLFFCYFLIFSNLIFSQSEKWRVNNKTSYISYKGKHVLHDWEGINKNVLGLMVVNSELKISELAILLKVEDFNSGNSNRDSHALEVLEILKYPQIRFYSNDLKVIQDNILIKGKFTFHGKSIEKTIPCKISISDRKIVLNGSFDFFLTESGIKLPSFLGFKIDDLVKISFKIEGDKDKI